MPHFALILSAAEETCVGPLKLQVFVGSMRLTLSINTPSCERSTVKFTAVKMNRECRLI